MTRKNRVMGKHRFRAILDEIAKSKGVDVTQLDVKTLVGETAGEIYTALEGRGEKPLKELREKMSHKGPLTMAAIGWLLREDKMVMSITEQGVTVRLQ
jgi:hypothetical protein